jgi:catechol 2,3-dioxygenase-like lactoylglutathione lyase family enzyme
MNSLFGLGRGTIFEAHVQTTDLERAMRFYGSTLEMELGCYLPSPGVAFYWIGGRGNAMLGVWEVAPDAFHPSHVGFTIAEREIDAALAALRAAGLSLLDLLGNPTDDPTVHAWMPACGIFFHDPDGNLLELVAMLEGAGRPDLGVVSLREWNARRAPETVAEVVGA